MKQELLRLKVGKLVGEKRLGGELYREYDIEIDNAEAVAYINFANCGDCENCWIDTEDYTITNRRITAKDCILSLKIDDCTILDHSMDDIYEQSEHIQVSVECSFIKPKKTGIKKIGKKKDISFLPCTLKMQNESNKSFSVLAVCFNKCAEFAAGIEDKQTVTVNARVKKSRQGDTFELNISSIELQ